MTGSRMLLAARCVCLSAVLGGALSVVAEERLAPARVTSSDPSFSDADRRAFASWALAQPEVRARHAGHRTRVLRVWAEAAKTERGTVRRASVLIRDYEAGIAREIAADLPRGPVQIRELIHVQPSDEEIEEGMSIIRRDPALLPFARNRELELVGGFHTRSIERADPCHRNVCLEFAFMRPNYGGPARYVIVDLSRRMVANRDFRRTGPEPRPQ